MRESGSLDLLMHTVHIIGAGLAGLAGTIRLADAGFQVHIHEAAGVAGGRCRSYKDEILGRTLDNGNHILLGGNKHAWEYIRLIGTETHFSMHEPEFAMVDVGTGKHFTLSYPFFNSPGTHFTDYADIFRLLLASDTATVKSCFNDTALFRNFIDPFSTAVLNTSPSQASAALFRKLLMELLLSGKNAWRYYLPRHSLSEAFIDRALLHIIQHQGHVHFHQSLKELEIDNGKITGLRFAQNTIPIAGETVILAIPHPEALLPGLPTPKTFNTIVNAHFLHAAPPQFTGVLGGKTQWIRSHEGILSTTTSAANALLPITEGELAALIWDEVCKALSLANTPLPPHRILREKQATFVATPENLRLRPASRTQYPNLFLAGDITATGLPGTIEGAIQSGFAAADMVLRHHSH